MKRILFFAVFLTVQLSFGQVAFTGDNSYDSIKENPVIYSSATAVTTAAASCVTNLISNGDFTNAATGNNKAVGWTFSPTKGTYVETYPENTYFTTGNPGYTAELDAGASLRQTVTVIPNISYTVSFIFARRSGTEAPSPSGVTVAVVGGTTGASSLAFSTTSLTPEIGTFTFTPTNASITLDFYNHLASNQTYGTIIDNIVLVPSSQVTPFATTIPKGIFNTLFTCAGTSVQLEVNNVPSSGVTYSWTGTAGATFSATNIKNPLVSFTGTGLKEATVTVTTAAGCVSSSTTYVNINSTNGPTITTGTTPATLIAVCQSATVQNTSMAYSITTNSPISYRIDWDTLADQGITTFNFPAGGGNVNTIVVPANTPSGTYTGTLILTNGNCSSTKAIILSVSPTPATPVLTNFILTCNQTTASQTWNASSNTSNYIVDVFSDAALTSYLAGYQNRPVTPSASSTESLSINGLLAGQTYYMRVKAVSSCGIESAYSNIATISLAISQSSDGVTWDNGGLTVNKIAKFTGSSNINVSSAVTACSCIVDPNVNVVIKSPGELILENGLDVKGTLVFENNTSLKQTNPAALNTGSIEYQRKSSPMKNFDFTYWSSPVYGDGIVVPKQTAKNLSPNTLDNKYFRFDPTSGWVFDDGEMKPGVGFIIRVPKPGSPAPDNWSGPTYEQPVTFKGIPNNGTIPFVAGADQFNLIGNPYPSAIDADLFITGNSNIIYGALYFWTHKTAILNNTYTANDYATYTLTGGVGTGIGTAPSGIAVPSRYIGAGQSFFVGSQKTPTTTKFEFTNAMRVSGNNTQFFKQASAKKTTLDEKNRVWLNLTNSQGAFKQLLVGYIAGATNDWDNLYDGPSFDGQPFVDFYSINQGKNLTIQGRALPFEATDEVPLGYRSTIAGPFEISIDARDGNLAQQEIWLEDKKTATLHDLAKGKYSFTAINGVENSRFVLKYTNKTLGTDDNTLEDKSLVISIKNKKITVSSSEETITQIQIFDLLGRKIFDKSKINAQEYMIEALPSSEQTLIVKTTLANGAISNKKIIF